MSFSSDASKNQAGATPGTNAPAAGATPNFAFGASGAGDAGKTLGTGFSLMSTPAQNKPGGLYGFGLPATSAQPTGFSFGATTSTTASTAGTPIASTQATGLTFGTPSTATGNTMFGAAPTTSISFGTPISNVPAAQSLTFGAQKATTGAAPPSTNVQAATSTGTGGLNFGTPITTTQSTGFSLGGATVGTPTTTAATTTTATGFTLGGTPATTSSSGLSLGFSLGAAATTSATTGFSLGSSATATTASGFSVGKPVSAAAPTSLATATTQASLGTTTTVTSSSATQAGAINFCQLEESINKWTLELEEQEKAFVNQAAQVNAWDKLLITNGEKIVTLNQEVERVKLEQQQLEHELDYVVGQQKELQDCLVPLEKELASLSVSDPEREYTYRLAENLDTQLKQMSEDLKEIIEHLNEANRTQDSSDPIVQIGKILNAHMNSLQWLDQRTSLLAQKIQQIDQMHQNFRQENERNFNLAYN